MKRKYTSANIHALINRCVTEYLKQDTDARLVDLNAKGLPTFGQWVMKEYYSDYVLPVLGIHQQSYADFLCVSRLKSSTYFMYALIMHGILNPERLEPVKLSSTVHSR